MARVDDRVDKVQKMVDNREAGPMIVVWQDNDLLQLRYERGRYQKTRRARIILKPRNQSRTIEIPIGAVIAIGAAGRLRLVPDLTLIIDRDGRKMIVDT